MGALELLSGDAQNFVEKIWASHVHVHEANPIDVVGLLSFDDVDHLLTSTAIRTPAVRLAKDGEVLPASAYTRSGATLAGQALTGLVDARKVIDLFEGGATVVLQGLHRYWPPLTRLVAELELALGHPCQANAYLTPPGSRGFAVHSDSHDVFVFQTHGTKLWEVHPTPGENAVGERSEPREVLLEPGLSMYLPTGTPHAARAEDNVSLHVTIGINQLTWRTLLDRAVREAMAGRRCGRPPAGRLPRPSRRARDRTVPAIAIAHRAACRHRRVGRRGCTDTFLPGAPELPPARIHGRPDAPRPGRGRHLAAPPAGQALCRRADSDGDRLQLSLGDRRLTVPARIADAVEKARTLEVFTPDDLGLDEQSALVLCRRLIREGLLEVVR